MWGLVGEKRDMTTNMANQMDRTWKTKWKLRPLKVKYSLGMLSQQNQMEKKIEHEMGIMVI